MEGINLAQALIERGYASLHFTAERSKYLGILKQAEDKAKQEKLKVVFVFVRQYGTFCFIRVVNTCATFDMDSCRYLIAKQILFRFRFGKIMRRRQQKKKLKKLMKLWVNVCQLIKVSL